MSKVRITEEKLTSLIEESIYELLQEGEYNESLGSWLGDKYQTMRNKVNQFRSDWKQGRSMARMRDKDYDPAKNAHKVDGVNPEDARNFDGQTFAKYRLQLMTDLYNKAPKEFKNELGSIIKSWRAEMGKKQTTGSTGNNTANTGSSAGTQNNAQVTEPTQHPTTTGGAQTQNTAARISEIENVLRNTYKQQLVNGHWQFQDQNGKITPTTAESNRRYHPEMYKLAWEWEELNNEGPSGLSENKKYLQKVVNESVNKTLKKYFKK